MSDTPATPIYVSQFFSDDDILITSQSATLTSVVKDLVNVIVVRHLPDANAHEIRDAILFRERAASTIICDGLALPHARVAGLDAPRIALGIYKNGVTFDPGKPPVKVVFLLLIPETQPARYLQILRAISKSLSAESMINDLAEFSAVDEVVGFFRRNELQLPAFICAADLMTERFEVLNESEPLFNAYDSFMTNQVGEVPVVNHIGDMIGVLTVQSMLRRFVPTTFTRQVHIPATPTLEILADVLKETKDIAVSDALDTRFVSVQVDSPAKEVAIELAEHNADICYVLKDKELVGLIPVWRFFSRILKD